MPIEFKRVPAIEKCFSILDHLAYSNHPLGISEIAKQLSLNKSTVFHIIHTLTDLAVLEQDSKGKFRLGARLFTLRNIAGRDSDLIRTVHPFLRKINVETMLSAFLGIRIGLNAVIVDKVDTAFDIKISSEIGMRLPLLAGAGGKALLCQLSDSEIDGILDEVRLKKFTPHTRINKAAFKKSVLLTRQDGIAFDNEEYIEGVVAFAVPLKTHLNDLQAAIWAVGLSHQVSDKIHASVIQILKDAANAINHRFLPNAESSVNNPYIRSDGCCS